MPGRLDSPGARRGRDVASGRSRDERGRFTSAVLLENRPRAVFGRRPHAGERLAMVASAARIDLKDKKAVQALRRRRQAWQSEAWDYFDEIGELGYTVTWIGNLMSKLRLYAAVRPDPKESAIPVDDPRSGVDEETAGLCRAALDRLRSEEGGQSALIRATAINLEVAGEAYLHAHEEGGVEDWTIRSVDELIVTGDGFALRGGPDINVFAPVPEGDLVVRLWERHPRFGMLATCAMRRVLGEAEALLLLSREIRAASKSRLSNGLLLLPSELSFGPVDPTREEGDGPDEDPFDRNLTEAMITPIQEEGSASAVVPVIVRGQGDYLDKVRHLALDRPLDMALDARIEGRIIRIARGLNAPTEVTTGFAATTFANANVIKQNSFDDHIQPRAVLICDAFTAGYFQPALVAAGVDPDRARDLFVWFDPTDLIVRPDQADQAKAAHEDGIISDAARRRYIGFTEADAPDDEEVLRRILLHQTRGDPFVFCQMLRQSGLFADILIPAPIGGLVVEEGAPTPIIVGGHNPTAIPETPGETPEEIAAREEKARAAMPQPPAPGELPPAPMPGEPPMDGPMPPAARPAAPAVAASGVRDWGSVGRRLAASDADLRARTVGALDQAMRTALDRAGARARSKMQRDRAASLAATGVPASRVCATVGRAVLAAAGVTEEELLSGSFDGPVEQVGVWVDQTQTDARATLVAMGLSAAAAEALAGRQRTARIAALAVLLAGLAAVAGRRLYDPTPGAPAAGEFDPAATVPAALLRAVLAVAGGDLLAQAVEAEQAGQPAGPLRSMSGDPLGAVAVGPDTLSAAGEAGGTVDGWTWDYGAAARRTFEPHEALDGTVFTSFDDDQLSNDQGFPEVGFFFPGDHDGCCCAVVPTLIPADETVDVNPEDQVPPEG